MDFWINIFWVAFNIFWSCKLPCIIQIIRYIKYKFTIYFLPRLFCKHICVLPTNFIPRVLFRHTLLSSPSHLSDLICTHLICFIPTPILSLHDNKPVYRLQQQSIRRLAFVPPYSVFCSISFRCGGLSIERNQKPLAPEITLAVTHHDRQKQVEVKRSSRVNPHEIRLFSGCPYAVVK